MEEDKDIKQFISKKPNASELRKKYPTLAKFLTGKFLRNDPNKYEISGKLSVASWELNQGKPKNPTYGMFSPGEYEFPTGDNIEKLIVLNGNIQTGNNVEMIADKYIQIIAKDVLKVKAYNNVTYLCLYEPKKKSGK